MTPRGHRSGLIVQQLENNGCQKTRLLLLVIKNITLMTNNNILLLQPVDNTNQYTETGGAQEQFRETVTL